MDRFLGMLRAWFWWTVLVLAMLVGAVVLSFVAVTAVLAGTVAWQHVFGYTVDYVWLAVLGSFLSMGIFGWLAVVVAIAGWRATRSEGQPAATVSIKAQRRTSPRTGQSDQQSPEQ